MTLQRLPNPAAKPKKVNGDQALRQEILAEQAASLGHAGEMVERRLQRLREFDAGMNAKAPRDELVHEAAYAVWSFFVQRELIGLRRQDEVIKHYRIPKDVLSRVGECVTRTPRKTSG